VSLERSQRWEHELLAVFGWVDKAWRKRSLEDIPTPVHLSHGEEDANAPVTMGRHLATSIPECRASFYSGEGRLHFVDRLPKILAAVSP
jgi:pimeloyl-ACP methyl ester carboxylesterase